MSDIVISDPTEPIELSSTKPPSSKCRSIRKRKIIGKEPVQKERPSNSNLLGPFWYEASSTQIIEGITVFKGITKREEQMLREIVSHGTFTPEVLANTVVPLNDEKSKTPRLRAFDWAVTNFAKGHCQTLVVDNNLLDPNTDYQSALRKHHRLLFDPFRRGTHIFFEVNNEIHRTTVGQLCFIKWCLENKVDKYVEDNLNEIRSHMAEAAKSRCNKKRRKELTKSNKNYVRGVVCEDLEIK